LSLIAVLDSGVVDTSYKERDILRRKTQFTLW